MIEPSQPHKPNSPWPWRGLSALPQRLADWLTKPAAVAKETSKVLPTSQDASLIGSLGKEPPQTVSLHDLVGAIESGDVPTVKKLLELKVDVNAKNQHGEPPLHVAARKGSVEIVRLLLEHGANVNATPTIPGLSYYNMRALNWAIQAHDFAVVKLLVEHGAETSYKWGGCGETPLHQAAAGPDESAAIVELLLSHGAAADVNAHDLRDDDSTPPLLGEQTPLHTCAKGHGSVKVAEVLLRHGADPTLENESGITPALEARIRNKLELAEFLEGWKRR